MSKDEKEPSPRSQRLGEFASDFDANFWTFWWTYVVFALTIGIGAIVFLHRRLNLFLVYNSRTFNFLKWYWWWIEIIQFPILLNLTQTGGCKHQ